VKRGRGEKGFGGKEKRKCAPLKEAQKLEGALCEGGQTNYEGTPLE
jgi:hypothetical protein